MPLVSILVPVYNREHLIARTLKSALAQTLASSGLVSPVLLIIGSVVTLHADLYPLIEKARQGVMETA